MTDGVTAEQIGTTAPQQVVTQDIEPRDDIRADVLAAYEKHSKPAPEPVAAAGEEETASPDRPRNERGQFIKADDAPVEAAPAEPVTDAVEPQDTPPEPSPANEAPKGLSADIRAKWQTLDPSIQAEFRRRDEAAENGARQWIEKERTYEQAFAPLDGFAERYNLDRSGALTRLLDWQAALERDPHGAILQLAQISGVDLNQPYQQPQSQPVTHDPRLDGIVATVSELQQTHIAAEIDRFKASPGHEHFDQVRVQMGKLMEHDPKLTMDQAYEQAIWLDPTVRAQLIQAQAQPAQQRAKDQQQVQKSRAAASPKGSGPTGDAPRPKPEYDTVREAVVAAARGAGWNV